MASSKDQRAARRQAARRKAKAEQAAAKKAAARHPGGAGTPPRKPAPPRAPSTKPPAPPAPEPPPDEPMGPARRVAWWALLATVFVVPVAMGNLTFLGMSMPLTFDSFDVVKMSLLRVLTLIALGAWGWDMLRRGGTLRRTPVDWVILAFLAWVALTTVTSVHWPTALFGKPRRYEGLLTFVNYAVLYFLVLQFVDSARRLLRLTQVLFWSSVVVACYGLLQYAGLDPVTWGALPFEPNRAFSTYGNPDLLGGFLIFSCAVALGLALHERRLAWRLVYWVGFGLSGLTMIVAFTRGAWIGGSVALVVLGLAAWRQGVRPLRVDWIPAGVSAALGITVVVRSLSSANEVMNFGKRLGSIFQFGSGSGQTRAEIWQAAFAAIRQRPVLGWGADTFRLVFPKFKPVTYVRDAGGASVADNAHDYPLQLATGVGIPGMLLFYGVFVWAGVRSFGTVFRRSADPARIIVAAFWAAAAGYLVQLLFGLSVTGVTFLLWTALAVVLAPTAKAVEVSVRRWGVVVAVALAAVCALGVGYQGVVLAADNVYMRSFDAKSLPEAEAATERAVRLNPFNTTYRTSLGDIYLAQANAALDAGGRAAQQGQDTTTYADALRQGLTKARAAYKEAIAFVPDEYDNYVALADVYNLAGEAGDSTSFQSALDVGTRALEIWPYGTAIRVQMARALLGMDKVGRAQTLLEYTMRIDPSGGQAAVLLAQIYKNQGRYEEAIALLQAVEARSAGQPGVADFIRSLEASAAAAP